ncbi:MTAP family purine nucleoside phosphorylase [Heliophilum fasciatum]|uniref:5'-methylthioadenosine phosphorylase n=1 Tax=Heliophilum fasciatum TaxID=35700 RepID=A0A4R2RVZ8_9FIRM|nr:MTAP family purine nucleoside phosphorylase [Heliophilum fasciatum]MCW2276928.1 5'-methylthioadenosine phosphorylase [Heliophilum fasciatum]TCP68612.1 5'-methylthioadenosine phosphorylase [Heliophilum fasciatum]
MTLPAIPAASFGIIGGSSTNSLHFPEDISFPGLTVLSVFSGWETPYGMSPPFVYFELNGQRALTCTMHGWRRGVTRADASRQIFWVFREAGVKRVLSEGGVGAINHLLRPRDLVVPHDYLDFSMRKDVDLGSGTLCIMRQAFCPVMRRAFVAACEELPGQGRVFDRSNYVVTDGRHFESPAEVRHFAIAGGDVIGQSVAPEVYLAREIGACYARMELVVNFAEGVITDWTHQELKDIFYEESERAGRRLLMAMATLSDTVESCSCGELRKTTLLQERKVPG